MVPIEFEQYLVSSLICLWKIPRYDLMHNSVSASSNAVHLIYPHTEEDRADLAKGKTEDRT